MHAARDGICIHYVICIICANEAAFNMLTQPLRELDFFSSMCVLDAGLIGRQCWSRVCPSLWSFSAFFGCPLRKVRMECDLTFELRTPRLAPDGWASVASEVSGTCASLAQWILGNWSSFPAHWLLFVRSVSPNHECFCLSMCFFLFHSPQAAVLCFSCHCYSMGFYFFICIHALFFCCRWRK